MRAADEERVLGLRCRAARSLTEAAELVVERACSGEGGYACLLNAHLTVLGRRDAAVAEALERAWATFADGAPVAWLQRRGGSSEAARVAGADLMAAVVDRGRARGLRHVLFGGSERTLRALEARLRDRFSGVEIVGALAPPVGSVEELGREALLKAIRSAEPHLVWVGLGAPKQELWLSRHAASLAPAVALGVGAAFDFLAETKPRAPRWMQRTWLEWLHRLAHEPRRLAWRYARTNLELLPLLLLRASRGNRDHLR